jgi:hypothetical protein
MLSKLKSIIENESICTGGLLETAAIILESDSSDIRDRFLENPDMMILGSEEDPDIANLVDSIPEAEEMDNVTSSEIEDITESYVPEALI